MAAEITMPQLSDTMTEGTVVKWHKKEGDSDQERRRNRGHRDRQGDHADGGV